MAVPRVKYYLAASDWTIVQVIGRDAWNKWWKSTSSGKRLLASTIVGRITVHTWFRGITYDGEGLFAGSVGPHLVRKYKAMTSTEALVEHNRLVDEIREKYGYAQGHGEAPEAA